MTTRQAQPTERDPEQALTALNEDRESQNSATQEGEPLFPKPIPYQASPTSGIVHIEPTERECRFNVQRGYKPASEFLKECSVEQMQAFADRGWAPISWLIEVESRHQKRAAVLDHLEDYMRIIRFEDQFGTVFMEQANVLDLALDDLERLEQLMLGKQRAIIEIMKQQPAPASPDDQEALQQFRERMQAYFHTLVTH